MNDAAMTSKTINSYCNLTWRLLALAFAGLILVGCQSKEPLTKFDVVAHNAVALRDGLAQGEFTASAVTAAYIERIALLDDVGPQLRAVVELNPDALAIAQGLDKQFHKGGVQGPLHGVPVLLKANIDTGDAMSTHAGSLALGDHVATQDAFLVQRLREAGAVILGKANLSEWANFRSTASSSGWSSVGGQTRNPYVLDRNPCGSSSGSAVAVAASLSALAIGTETNGSIVCPASVNGIVGIKPSVGIVSRRGIIPIAPSQDTAGPMAKSVAGAALLLESMLGVDASDAGARLLPGSQSLVPDPQRLRMDGVRIGVIGNYFGAEANAKTHAVFHAALAQLQALGAVIAEPVDIPIEPAARTAGFDVMLYEFKSSLNHYLEQHAVAQDRDSLAELIVYNQTNAQTIMPIFGQEIFAAAQAKGDLQDPQYQTALAASVVRMRAALDNLFASDQLDALVLPTNAPAWKTDWLAGDRFMLGSSSYAAVSGYPSVTVPAGYISGLPVGLSFVGPEFSDAALIQLAYTFEQATKVRVEPSFIQSLEQQ